MTEHAMTQDVEIIINAELDSDALNALFFATWPAHERRDFTAVLEHSLVHVSARIDEQLVGFVHVAHDGGEHSFLLDPTVHPDTQHLGIGLTLVRTAIAAARERGALWMHAAFAPELEPFYDAAGFRMTRAGLVNLQDAEDDDDDA